MQPYHAPSGSCDGIKTETQKKLKMTKIQYFSVLLFCLISIKAKSQTEQIRADIYTIIHSFVVLDQNTHDLKVDSVQIAYYPFSFEENKDLVVYKISQNNRKNNYSDSEQDIRIIAIDTVSLRAFRILGFSTGSDIVNFYQYIKPKKAKNKNTAYQILSKYEIVGIDLYCLYDGYLTPSVIINGSPYSPISKEKYPCLVHEGIVFRKWRIMSCLPRSKFYYFLKRIFRKKK